MQRFTLAPLLSLASRARPHHLVSTRKPRTRKVPVVLATGTSKAGTWLGNIRLSGFSVLIMSLTLLGVLILAPQLKILVEQRQQIADLQSIASQRTAELTELQKQRARWDDPAYVRAQARDRLYYVMPGEISYLVLNDANIDELKREKASASVQNTNSDWVAGLLGSFLVAGLGNQAPATPAPAPAKG
jgi:cell division protein FtsB